MRWIALACILTAPGPLRGQTPAKPLSFEVASVKPASAPVATKDDYSAGYNAGMRAAMAAQGLRVRGNRVTIVDNSLRDLIRLAYQVKDYQIAAPGWMAEEKYQVDATLPAGATAAQAPEMLRTLLEERFHLKLHRESRKMPVYALVESKGGAKLTPSQYKAGTTVANPGRAVAVASTVAAFADALSKAEDRIVVDSTGIAGSFDFNLTYTPETLASLLNEQYGLRLEKREQPLEVLVIESADKVPSEN